MTYPSCTIAPSNGRELEPMLEALPLHCLPKYLRHSLGILLRISHISEHLRQRLFPILLYEVKVLRQRLLVGIVAVDAGASSCLRLASRVTMILYVCILPTVEARHAHASRSFNKSAGMSRC